MSKSDGEDEDEDEEQQQGSSALPRQKPPLNRQKTTKKINRKRKDKTKSQASKRKAPPQKKFERDLGRLIAYKINDMEYKKRKHDLEEEGNRRKRMKMSELDLTDFEDWMEFAKRFNDVKETVGGSAVHAALQFPEFAETNLLTEEEKIEFDKLQQERQGHQLLKNLV